MKPIDTPLKTVISLSNMIREMNRKHLELKRITKTASLLLLSGFSSNSVPLEIVERCLKEQQKDGGWVSIVDTAWNAFFLKQINEVLYLPAISHALQFIITQMNSNMLWGRSKRDMSRIPVSGLLLYLFPELSSADMLLALEQLWLSEKNSLTYKASYILMAFNRCYYQPQDETLIVETIDWLVTNQREDGGFSPWKEHPMDSDVYCTAIALLGLLQYPTQVPVNVFDHMQHWLVTNRLEKGLWKYHEIEDGASWGLYAWTQLLKHQAVTGDHG